MDSQALGQQETLETEPAYFDERAVVVYCWRAEQLLRAGYSVELADELAGDRDVDLHLACDLLHSGCPEQTAYAILS